LGYPIPVNFNTHTPGSNPLPAHDLSPTTFTDKNTDHYACSPDNRRTSRASWPPPTLARSTYPRSCRAIPSSLDSSPTVSAGRTFKPTSDLPCSFYPIRTPRALTRNKVSAWSLRFKTAAAPSSTPKPRSVVECHPTSDVGFISLEMPYSVPEANVTRELCVSYYTEDARTMRYQPTMLLDGATTWISDDRTCSQQLGVVIPKERPRHASHTTPQSAASSLSPFEDCRV
jgi:hypothetical protein